MTSLRTRLLQNGERFFKTDIRYVLKNGSWMLFGQGITAICAFVLSVAFANWLPVYEYGIYKFVLATTALVTAIKLTGLKQAVIQATSRGATRTVFTAMRASLRWGCIPMGLSVVVGGYYLFNGNPVLGWGIMISSVGAVLISALGLYGGALLGAERFKALTIDNLTLIGANTVTLLIALSLTDNVLIILAANTLSTLVTIAGLAYIYLRHIDRSSQSDMKAISFGKHTSVQNLLTTIAAHIDKILLFQQLGSVELAIYGFAQALPDQVRGILKNILSIIVPRYAKLSPAALRRSIAQKTWQLTLLILLPIGLYILIAPIMFAYVFPQYVDAQWYSQLFAAGLITMPSSLLLTTYFQVLEKTRTLYYCNIISSLIRLILTIVAIILFGLIGAVVATLAGRVVTLGTLAFFYFTERTDTTPPTAK